MPPSTSQARPRQGFCMRLISGRDVETAFSFDDYLSPLSARYFCGGKQCLLVDVIFHCQTWSSDSLGPLTPVVS